MYKNPFISSSAKKNIMTGVMRLLPKALKNRFGMSDDDARALAGILKSIFNGKKEIEDSSLDKCVRALFYELQKERFLRVRREVCKEKNRLLRKYYWYLDIDTIREEASRKIEEDPGEIYRVLPRRAWSSRTR